MSFVVDSAEWSFDGWSSDKANEILEAFLARIETATARKEQVWIGDDLQSRSVHGELDLWSLRASDSPLQISPEVWQELAAWLSRAKCYLDEPNWPDGFEDFDIAVDAHEPRTCPDWAWAHHNVRTGKPVGCLGLERAGKIVTSSSNGEALVHWVKDEAGQRAFWRAAIDILGDSPATIEALSQHAFPDIWFHDGAINDLNKLVGGYWPFRHDVRKILEVMDDWGAWIFCASPPKILPSDGGEVQNGRPSDRLVEKRFQARGLTAAPEKPNVRADKTCREAREITIARESIVRGQRVSRRATLYCEWHFKLELHQNRIHVHAPEDISDGKTVVAIIHEHLPLPGD